MAGRHAREADLLHWENYPVDGAMLLKLTSNVTG